MPCPLVHRIIPRDFELELLWLILNEIIFHQNFLYSQLKGKKFKLWYEIWRQLPFFWDPAHIHIPWYIHSFLRLYYHQCSILFQPHMKPNQMWNISLSQMVQCILLHSKSLLLVTTYLGTGIHFDFIFHEIKRIT